MKDLKETKKILSYSEVMKEKIDYWGKRYDPHKRLAIIQDIPDNEKRASINKRYFGDKIKALMMNFFL
jgi:hypothetical protein